MSMVKKYLKKDIYFQKKEEELLMSWNQNKSKVSKHLQKNNSETVKKENDKEMPKEISIERKKKDINLLIILDQLWYYNNGISKNNKFLRQHTKSTNQIYNKNLSWNKWWLMWTVSN